MVNYNLVCLIARKLDEEDVKRVEGPGGRYLSIYHKATPTTFEVSSRGTLARYDYEQLKVA